MVQSAVFSPDGTRILTASEYEKARLLDAATGRALAVLEGHTGWVDSAVFSPDGARILTASADKTARLWDISSLPRGNLFQVACIWLPDRDLSDITKEYGFTALDPICESEAPLPDPPAH